MLYAPNSMVLDNVITDSTGNCITLDRTSSNVTVMGNLLMRCSNGIGFSNLNGARVYHNTISNNSGAGISLGLASGVDVRNNIFTYNQNYGRTGSDNTTVEFDYNLFFMNVPQPCNGCTLGANDQYGDPLYNDPGMGDYSLDPMSPAVNSGLDLMVRAFLGSAPDMGYLESN